jgi:hypothetical protein
MVSYYTAFEAATITPDIPTFSAAINAAIIPAIIPANPTTYFSAYCNLQSINDADSF